MVTTARFGLLILGPRVVFRSVALIQEKKCICFFTLLLTHVFDFKKKTIRKSAMLQTGIDVFLETGFLFLPQFSSDECSINPINRSITQSSSCKLQNFPNLGFTKHVSTSLSKIT